MSASQQHAKLFTPTDTPPTSTSPSSSASFVVGVMVNLTVEQHRFLQEEVKRRKLAGETSKVPAARGSNRNVNMGMVVREALELQFDIQGQSPQRGDNE